MFNKEFTQNLKVGDKFCTPNSSDHYTIYTVKRITKTEIVASFKGREDLEIRFSKETGKKCNSDIWHSELIQEITPEIIEKIKKRNILYKIKKIEFDNLPYEVLEKIYQLVEKNK